MSDKISLFFENIKNKKIAFIGVGVSHYDLIKLFLSKQIKVTVLDKRNEQQIGDKYVELKNLGVDFVLGYDYLETLLNYDIIFRSPGMNYFNEHLVNARQFGKVVTSETELFFDLCPCKIYAITGSDGKTTTTTLISELLKSSGKAIHLGGNIGKPLFSNIENININDVAVVELSSFQLISIRKSPNVAVITNISPNHLDVHKDMEEYVGAKLNLIKHQNAFSKTILNLDDGMTEKIKKLVRGKLVEFSRKYVPFFGAFLDKDGDIYICDNGKKTFVMNKQEIKIPGIHNVENYLTAISAVYDDVSIDTIVKVANTFGGVEHRIEFVRELDGVRWYNDSIATSPTRTIAGLNSFDKKLIVIAGGYDKNIPYEPLAPVINERVKVLILMGDTAQKIKNAVLNCANYNVDIKIHEVSDMEQAVEKAKEIAVSGDVVTLSPASASFDKYPNFEVRGNHFKDIVKSLI